MAAVAPPPREVLQGTTEALQRLEQQSLSADIEDVCKANVVELEVNGGTEDSSEHSENRAEMTPRKPVEESSDLTPGGSSNRVDAEDGRTTPETPERQESSMDINAVENERDAKAKEAGRLALCLPMPRIARCNALLCRT